MKLLPQMARFAHVMMAYILERKIIYISKNKPLEVPFALSIAFSRACNLWHYGHYLY